MIKVQSLKRTIILQFAVILLPVVVLLAFQSFEDIQRADVLQRLQRMRTLAQGAHERYTVFSHGAGAVTADIPLSASALAALKSARDQLAELSRRADARSLAAAAQELNAMAQALEENPHLDTLNVMSERITSARSLIYRAQTDSDQRVNDAVQRLAEQSRLMAQWVVVVTMLVLAVALLFVWRLVRGLSRPLTLAVSVADRIAEGRPVEEREFNLRGDVGDLIRSLGRMYRSLNVYKDQAAEYQRGLEEKFEQLAESQSSLAEAQHLAQMGNWYWDIAKPAARWSDEMYRILGYQPGGCAPDWKNFVALVDVREQQALHQRLQGAMAAPGSFSAENQITTPDGLYRVIHSQTSSVADAGGKVVRLHGTVHDITERKHAEDKMHYLAMYDALTGLPNRQLFHQQLEQSVARATRNRTHIAIMFIDLDRFKRINDTLGHATGDMLLREVAARLNSCVRTTDAVGRDGEPSRPEGRVARLAGDEFTVTLDTLHEPQDAARVARRIIAEVSRPFMLSGQEVVVTTSIGIAVYPEDGEQAEILLKNADVAMYQAKRQGRNTYQYFAGEMNSAAVERLRLENELRRAMERGQFFLNYQIKIDARDGSIAGAEALMRWRHPELGLVPPVQFIPVAEEIGLIVSFGEWVLDEACRQLKVWRDAGLPLAEMAVNLASPSFRQPDLVERVASALRRHGVHPSCLCIEATESILMRDADATMSTLKQLRELGVKLSIDDFGTGYSSLSYLRRFPIDQLKIDRSFVNEVAVNSDDAAIVAAIASLARSLSLDVVAEGVETVEQARLLAKQGCHIMQGYFFSKPLLAEELTPLLAQGAAFNLHILERLSESPEVDDEMPSVATL